MRGVRVEVEYAARSKLYNGNYAHASREAAGENRKRGVVAAGV
jgi:hypothetical protein